MAGGYVNIWSAGQDALLEALARRDAAAQLEEENARRAQLDLENQADRAAMREHNRKVLQSQDEDRDERRKLAEAAAKGKAAETEEKQAYERLRQDAIYAYQHAPDEKERAKFREALELQFGMKFEKPKEAEPAKPQWVSGRDKTGKHIQTWKVPEIGETSEPYHPPRAEPREDPRLRDDPAFPPGAKAWVDEMIALGNPLEDTVSTVVRGWPQQRQAHPQADLGKAVDYVKKFYTGQYNDPIMKKPTPPTTAQPAAGAGGPGAGSAAVQAPPPPMPPPAAPSQRAQGPGPRAGGPPVAAPPPATQKPGGPPAGPPRQFSDAEVREAAIAALTEGKAQVNEQNIAIVMGNIRKQLGGGK